MSAFHDDGMQTLLDARPVPSLPWRRSVRPALRTRTLAAAFGILAFAVSFAGSWIPSFWGDEAASIMSAERSFPSLFSMLWHVDAVHGSYYVLLHAWIDLFGTSPLSVRLPSAIGVGLAAAGTVVLAEQLFSRRVAIIAGVLFAVLPRVSYMGAEARTYAISTAAAVWLTVLLTEMLVRGTTRPLAWAAYALGLAAGVYLFLYLALLVAVHGIVILTTKRRKGVFKRWSAAIGLAVLLAAPLLVFAIAQRHQIAFLGAKQLVAFGAVAVDQWFGNAWVAVPCWALIVFGCVMALRARFRAQLSTQTGGRMARPRASGFGDPSGFVLAVAWLVLPTALLLAGDFVFQPMYTYRYLSFCVPAVALLTAVGIAALPRTWVQAVAVIVILALVFPGYLRQRTDFAKPGGSDWAQVSAVMARYAKPGDAVVFDEGVRPSRKPRLAMHVYPEGFQGLDDVALLAPYDETGGLWDSVAPLASVGYRLERASIVWALEAKVTDQNTAGSDLSVLRRDGFAVTRAIAGHTTIVYELRRAGS